MEITLTNEELLTVIRGLECATDAAFSSEAAQPYKALIRKLTPLSPEWQKQEAEFKARVAAIFTDKH